MAKKNVRKSNNDNENTNVMSLEGFNGVFGLPPKSHVSDTAIMNSMPMLQIQPGLPDFESGLTLFSINTDTGWTRYEKILKKHGFALPDKSLKLAFIADNFPTDSFTNEYGETFLQKFTDVASQGMQQLAQITNSQTGTEAMKKLAGGTKKAFEGVEGGTAGLVKSGAEGLTSGVEGLERLMQNVGSQSQFLGGALNTVNKMLAGNRVDFPQIWRNSGFTPSYTATIRLYNPNPGNKLSTKRHILGPIASILALSLPQSLDGKTFKWPFFLRVVAPGIYRLDPAVITNVTIVKGGDQQQISFNQQMAMVDVRIDFSSLYSSMVAEVEPNFQSDRPTLRNYLYGMEHNDEVSEVKTTRKEMRNNARSAAGVGEGPTIKVTPLPNINAAAQNSVETALAKNAAARRRQAPTVTEEEVDNRVNTEVANVESTLAAASNPDFITSA